MYCKIAVFLGRNLYARLMPSFDVASLEKHLQIKIDFFSYDNILSLKDLFLSVEPSYDGFVADSIIPYRILCLSRTHAEKPCDHMVISYERIYRTMLVQSLSSNSFDLSRIGMDYLLFGKSLQDAFLTNTLKDEVDKYAELVKNSTEDELIELTERKFQIHYQDWESGRKDFFFTRSEKCVDYFESHNIPYCFITPNEEDLLNILSLMIRNIEIKKMIDDYSAVIRFMSRNGKPLTRRQSETIISLIDKFNKKQFTNFFVRKSPDSIRIETNMVTIQQFTENLTICPFLTLFPPELLENVVIGYGCGPNLYTSQIHSIDSCIYGRSDSSAKYSYFTGAASELVTLQATVNQDEEKKSSIDMVLIKSFAHQAKLSATTILKILRCMQQRNTNRLTATILEEELGIATRTANKYLLNLNVCGLSQVVDTENSGGKGRPMNVYEINIPYK